MARPRRTDRILKGLRERKYRLRGGKGRTTRFIPDADREFAHMARLFALHVERHARRFGLSTEKVEGLSIAVAAFREALSRTMQPTSAGPRATRIKNEARRQAEKIVRGVARHLRGITEESLDDVDRMNLNLAQRPTRPRRLVCPQVAPVLRFAGSTDPHGSSVAGHRHILEYGNDFDLASSAKPHGAVRLELFVGLAPAHAGAPIPAHPGQCGGGWWWYLRSYTTKRFEVEFPVMDDGTPMLVCYWGRWADSSGRVGPFSQTCAARVEGGAGVARHALPGAQSQRMRVTQVRDRIEAKFVVIGRRALPGAVGEEAQYALPDGGRDLVETSVM